MRRVLLLAATALAGLVCPWAAQAQAIASYTGGPDDPNAGAGYQAMVRAIGLSPTVMLAYVDSTIPMSGFVASARYEAQAWASAGWTHPPGKPPLIPMLGLPMVGAGEDADQAFKAIASGRQDSMITGVLQAWADAGAQAILLRPGFEMNGGWFAWSVTAANAADFVAAFQHITTLARGFQNAIVSVIFNPNVGGTVPLSAYYPGNHYVDIIGLDTYGSPVNNDMSPANAGDDTDLSIASLVAFAKTNGKPFAFCETGSGTADTTFPRQLAAALLQQDVPVLVAGFWNVDDPNGQMRWTDNAEASVAWRAVANIIAGSKYVSSLLVSLTPSGQTPSDAAATPAASPDATLLASQAADLQAIQPVVLATNAPSDMVAAPPSVALADPSAPPITVAQDEGVYTNSTRASAIVVTGQGDVVTAFGGPETVTLRGAGTALSTGPYNDTVTVQSSGNTIDLGWGNDTITLAYPQTPSVAVAAAPTVSTEIIPANIQATAATLLASAEASAAAPPTSTAAPAMTPVAAAGNRFYLPGPGTGVLTINGALASNDSLDLSHALAGTTWDHQAVDLGQYVTVGTDKQGVTVSVKGVVVARIVGKQTAGLQSLITAN